MIPSAIVLTREAPLAIRSLFAEKKYSKIGVLVDENTESLCYPLIKVEIPEHHMIKIASGEEHKNLTTCNEIWHEMTRLGFDRKSLLINLGGGVIGDMGGFCAATFKRGINFINIPTTLLAQVDASIGGKLGIDFEGYKNHIGLFHDPDLVIIDPVFLDTLDVRELKSGYAEIIKHCLIADAEYLDTVVREPFEDQDWGKHIAHSLQVKSRVTLEDPLESGLRKILNFGHTIGHAVESFFLNTPNKLLHGEAIAIGMICESFLSMKKTHLPAQEMQKISNLLKSIYGKHSIDTSNYLSISQLTLQDKKNTDGQVHAALLTKIGNCTYDIPIDTNDIKNALDFYNSI
jgi:3-dehydroquinate synthase